MEDPFFANCWGVNEDLLEEPSTANARIVVPNFDALDTFPNVTSLNRKMILLVTHDGRN